MALHDEIFCTSTPEYGHHPKRQTADGMEEYETFDLGFTNVKKNKWKRIGWLIKWRNLRENRIRNNKKALFLIPYSLQPQFQNKNIYFMY